MVEVFVTGGSGFVGSHLITRLVQDGHAVRVLVRSDEAAQRVTELDARPCFGDLQDGPAIRSAAEGCELVFHTAAKVSRGGGRDRFWTDNVDGTATVLQSVREAGVRRLVHVGSLAALMAGKPLVQADESTPLRPDSRSDYASSKAAAAQLVQAANGSRLETVVVRPPWVWGPGDTTTRTDHLTWINGGRHLIDTAHVANLVHALCLAADKGLAGESYLISDGAPVEFREFITGLLTAQGFDPPSRSVPRSAALASTALGEGIWQALRLRSAPPLDYLSLWLFSQECTVDTTKAREELGYEPVLTREEGLAGL
ncbi:NAD-dependent epimerase/dehydratase family protein [Pseudonocardiaceae bacterium YIM PH 21723]|nr:NAD-dependent epimerase/dehydratase family protein [Pseudonocardiaceae bacterium YIM PH 21723]